MLFRRFYITTIFLAVLFFAGYALVFHVFGTSVRKDRALQFLQHVPDRITGYVCSKPSYDVRHTVFVFCDLSDNRILTTANVSERIEYGDEVEIAVDDIVREKRAQYIRQHIHIRAKGSVLHRVSSDAYVRIARKYLYRLRVTCTNRIYDLFDTYPKEYAGLMSGMILEGSAGVSSEVKKDFRIAGLSHIVALSGFNVSIAIDFLGLLFNRFRRSARIVFSVLTAIAFGCMVDFSAPIMRAVLMVVIARFAEINYRSASQIRVLAYAVTIIYLYDPIATFTNISLHLSVLATAGLILFEKHIGHYMPTRIRSIIAPTLAANVGVTPYVICAFGTLSTYFLISNVLVLPLIPYLMLITCVLVVNSFLIQVPIEFISVTCMYIQKALMCVSALGIQWILFVAKKVSDFPYAYVFIWK